MLSSTFSFSDGDIIQLVVVTVRAHVLCVLSCRLFLKRVHGGTFPAFDSSQPDPGCAVEFGMLQPLVDPTYDHDAPGLDVSVHTHTHTRSAPAQCSAKQQHPARSQHAAAASTRMRQLSCSSCQKYDARPPLCLLPCLVLLVLLQLDRAAQYDPEDPQVRLKTEMAREGRC